MCLLVYTLHDIHVLYALRLLDLYSGASPSIRTEAMVHSPQDGQMGPPIFDHNAPQMLC